MNEAKTVFITGATSGLGLSIATRLATEGYNVIGTSRDVARIRTKLPFELLQLDVTSDLSVQECIRTLFFKTPRVDVIVNNAGMAVAGPAEETARGESQLQFETNFWGPVRVIKQVLPMLRQQKSGLIINVSSLAGLVGVPFQAFYSASKHALEGYTKSLRLELAPFNIQVTLIEPGFIRTNLHHSAAAATERVSDYDTVRPQILQSLTEFVEGAPSPEIVAALLSKILRTKRPKLQYRIGMDANFVPLVSMLLPRLFEGGMKKKFHLQ